MVDRRQAPDRAALGRPIW